MMTVPSSAGNPASPQSWINQSSSPTTPSAASQGVAQLIPQPIAHEMSGDSVQTEAYGMMGDPTRSRVYEMVGDAPRSWI
jgi:hypothetical protein